MRKSNGKHATTAADDAISQSLFHLDIFVFWPLLRHILFVRKQ